MSNKINILVIPSDKSGCGYFRSKNPHEYLANAYKNIFNVDIQYSLSKEDILNESFSKYDIVHIHKQLDDNCELIREIKAKGCKVIVDVDDYYDLGNDHPLSKTAKLYNWKKPIIEHIKLADLVTTTTVIYKNELLKLNKNVVVIPNAIDPNEPQFRPQSSASKRLRFGIICGSSHLEDIKILSNSIKLLSKEILDKIQIVLCGFDTNGVKKIINRQTNEIKTVPIEPKESCWYQYEKILTNDYKIVSEDHKKFLHEFIKNIEYYNLDEPYRRCWTKPIDSYATHYNNIDVLLIPLKENKFNLMKSQIKIIESGFLNKAVIAQNYGPYTLDLIPMIEKGGTINEHGNALLVDSTKNHKQWAKYITYLVNNKEMVHKLQTNLHNTVKDKYDLKNISEIRASAYIKLLQK